MTKIIKVFEKHLRQWNETTLHSFYFITLLINITMKAFIINIIRTRITLILIFLFLTALLISLVVFQKPNGPHDGIVKEAGTHNIEVKNLTSDFYTYLLDKKNMPISNVGISCEVNFKLSDQTSINMPLIPYGKDGFCNPSNIPNFNTCSVNFNVFGKLVSAQFENEYPIAQQK